MRIRSNEFDLKETPTTVRMIIEKVGTNFLMGKIIRTTPSYYRN